jgi:hypothetical protein
LIDKKYNTANPNIFSCPILNSSILCKGFMWAVYATKFGYRWKVGDGCQVKFWEDTWFGTSPLAVQFWTYIVFAMSNLLLLPRFVMGQS